MISIFQKKLKNTPLAFDEKRYDIKKLKAYLELDLQGSLKSTIVLALMPSSELLCLKTIFHQKYLLSISSFFYISPLYIH